MHSLTSSVRRSRISVALVLAILAAVVGVRLSAQQQPPVSSSNVNMVSGTTFPDGDPYLQRQNEPNAAVSTGNALHLLAGANDYRTVDLPGPFDPMRGFKMAADAWLGLFKSVDGGKTWKSTLLPGFPQDESSDGNASPLKWRLEGGVRRGYEGATDPVVRSGTNGLFYYAGVAFTRGVQQPSAIFVARYMDLNNREAGDPFGYVDTRLVDQDQGTRFLDKVALAVDIPRGAATCSIRSYQSPDKPGEAPIEHLQTIPAGPVYVAYAAFTGSGATEQSVIMLSRSTNCGQTWSTPIALSTGSRLVQNPQIAVSPVDGAVYVSWRRFKYSTQDHAVMIAKSVNGGASFGPPLRVSGLRSFDLVTSATQFRSNGFQTMAIDGTGRVYLAWPDRGYATVRSDPVTGDSRIVLSTSATGATWTVPKAIQAGGIGHQLMPAMTFHGGKLRILYYDLREDVSQIFGPEIDDAKISELRHTMDVSVAQAAPGSAPVFTTARVSEYASGFVNGSTVEQQLQFNPPNLPMFRQGFVPFMGDYIDLAPSAPFVLNANGTWAFNTGANGSTVSHAVWTDNRDVRAPKDGNWANYTPVTSDALGAISRFDGTTPVPNCDPGQVGMRNQNIYTARVTDGLFVSAPGNTKPFTGFPRAFVVVAENASALPRFYRLTIEDQPAGGQASFLQFGAPLTTLDVATPAFSSVARTVFVTAPQDSTARIRVSVVQVTGVGGPLVTEGLTGEVVLNPNLQNPVLQNPVLQNPVLQNPVLQNIAQGETYNPAISVALVGTPNLQNPVLQNPNLQNPNLQNPTIQNPYLQNPNLQNPVLQNPVLQNDLVANPNIVNPNLQNPVLQNPVLQNPNLQNPNLQNPNLQNAGISDTNWVVTNGGNTTASYTINLALTTPVPSGFTTQLLIHKTTLTPAALGCELGELKHTVLLANIPDPQFLSITDPNLQNPNLQNPNLQNPTVALAPGDSATVTLRIIDPNIFDGVTYDASAGVTPAAVAQSVNTDDAAAGDTTPSVALPLTITTSEIPPTTPGAPIDRTIGFVAATGTVTCAVVSGLGELPPGVALSSSGTLSGTPTTPGNYVFTIECVDSGPPERRDRQTLTIQVNPASPVSFDALWNGQDSNWYNPANWSPRGVPSETARVYLSAATTVVPKLTADVTVRDLFLEPGATLDTNGFTLTVTNNADAGRTIIGLGQTVLTGNGSVAAGVFSNLVIAGRITLAAPMTTTGTLTLAPGARLELNGQPLIVGGQLITNATGGALPMVVAGAGNSFIVSGVNVNGLVLSGAPLTINGAALTRFDNVSLSGFAPEAIQLTVNHPGLLTHFPMNGLSFSSQPTSGQYISATDTQPGGALLIFDVTGAVPADGSAFTLETGGAEVNWLGNPGEANLAVTQTVAPVPAAAGTRLTYVISVTNGGPLAAANVILNASVPVGATGLQTSTPQGVCTPGPIGVSCALGTIASGASVQATVSFLTSVTGTLSTTAVVSSTTPDAVIANNSHTINAVIVAVGEGVDLRLTKTDSLDPVALNTPFTYTLTLANVGTTQATNVVVTDNAPSGISITYATSPAGMCSAGAAQVLCSFASILPGQTVTMTLNAQGTATGTWTNQASVTSAQVELTPSDNVVSETTRVIASGGQGADLFLEMSESSDPVAFGTPFTWSILAQNEGPAPATGVVVTNTLPIGVSLVSAIAAQGSCTVQNRTVTCSLGTLGVGASTGIKLTVTAAGAGALNNTAVVAATQADPVPENNTASAETTVVLGSCAAPTFGPPVAIAMPTYDGTFMHQADLNGDGATDLVVSLLPNGLVVRLNNGNGTFAAAVPVGRPTPLTFDNAPRDFALADLNGDGKIDIAVATGSGVDVLIGGGDGTFAAPVNYALVAPEPLTVIAVDLDKDGDLDLVLDNLSDTDAHVQFFRNTGNGTFGAGQLVTMGAVQPAFPLVADFNHDGFADIVAGSWQGVISIALADGEGGYLPAITYTTVGSASPIVAGDVNGDGHTDMIVAGDGSDDQRLWLGDGTGHFTRGAFLGVGATGVGTRLLDINGDGRSDLVVAHPRLGTVAVQLGVAGGTFAAPIHYASPFQFNEATLFDDGDDISGAPEVADFNGDGQLDIAMVNPSGSVNLLFSTCGSPSADLLIAIQESADPIAETAQETYTVTATNQGSTAVTGAVVHLSVGGVFEPNHPSLPRFVGEMGVGCTVSDQHIVCTLPSLAPGANASLEATMAPGGETSMTLSASVASANADPVPANNTAIETTAVTPSGRRLTVINTNDSGPGSLRQAIVESNSDSGDQDVIVFAIPGSGVPTITLQDGLGAITQPVVIDGTTQPGAGRVELNGNNLQATGLVIQGGNSIVRGLVINRFAGDGMSLEAGGGNVVEGNFIGTDSTGALARPNGTGGIRVFSANNRIGGLAAAARNVISGNQSTGITLQNATATGNVVQGNYIGLNAEGTAALPNAAATGGIAIFNGARNNTLGGAVAGAGNVVSGNIGGGITVNGAAANDNLVQGNFIGTDPSGLTRLANGGTGVDVAFAQRTIVGGTGLARNVISGNGIGIQIRSGATGTRVRNNYIGLNAAGAAVITNSTGISISGTAGADNVIGGSQAGEGNVISGNTAVGINISGGSNGTTIQGNVIGLDAGGTLDLGNASDGITLNGVSGTTVGGNTDGARNVISGNNGIGVRITGAGATGNVIRGNYIGLNATGDAGVANSSGGISITTATNNTIGGSSAGEGNVISGNTTRGIFVQSSANGTTIQGNLIGLNAAGTLAVANTTDGIGLSGVSGTIIGGTAAGAANVISGNTAYGINNAAGTTGTIVRGNRIGTNAAGSGPVPNGISGLFVDGNGMTIGGTPAGAANVIAHNALNGVNVAGGAGHTIVGNSIFLNGALGINLGPAGITDNDAGDGDSGANNHQNFPVLAAAAGGVQGSFNSTPNATFTIHYYGNTACDTSGNGEGQTYLGEATVGTGPTGDASIPFFAVTPVQIVTATATSAGGDTSEFSTCVTSGPTNNAPVANAGPDQSGYVERLVTLDGSGSDADSDDLTYAWTFVSRPAGSQAVLSNATLPSAAFTPDVVGTYTVQLVVDDGTDTSVPDSVSVTVLSNAIALSLVGAQVVGVTREAPVSVTLPFAAPAGGTTVTLTSLNTGLLSVVAPGTASIPQGQTAGQIMVKGEGSGTAVLRANATGYGQGTLSVLVTHNLVNTPSTLNVAFGASTALPINIGPDPAPAGGLTLTVASSDADIEVLTPQVTVPAGALSVNATVRGARVGTANVTVSNPNYAPSTTVVTSRAELNIVETSASFNQGLSAPTITVRLESGGTQIAAQPALAVTLTSANTGCVTVPSSVTIPLGLVSTSFIPAYGGTATLPCTATVTASASDVTADTVSVTVNRPAAINPSGTVTVGAGLMTSAGSSLSASQHGGVDVTIAAGPGPVRVSRLSTEVGTQSITVHLNNGQTTVSYYVHGLENTTGTSTLTLTAPGFTSGSQTVDVAQAALEIVGLTQSMNTLSGADTDLYVQVGITHPSYNNTQLWSVQSVRPGSTGFQVTLSNNSSAVARLRSDEPVATGGQTGQVVTKTIPAGTYFTQALATGTSYGLAFEPLGTGNTTVTVSAPNALTMTSTGVRQVQVTSPVINAGGAVTVGAGLMTSTSASLSAAQHGGVDVTIAAPPGPVRLSRASAEVGTQSITVHVSNGQTTIPYYVHGLENTTGSSTITLTADRFTSASHSVEVVQPGLEIVNLTGSMNTLSGPDTDVYAQVGITHPSYNNAQLWQVQIVRPGSAGLQVTLTNSNSAVARLRSDEPVATGGQTGQVVTKTIPAGTYYTQGLAAGTSYGLAFEPLGTGNTTVTVSATNALTMTSAGVRQVQVTSPVISAGGAVTVGAGLMTSTSASLSAGQHGGVDVTITAPPGPVRLSRLATEVGTQSITVHLNNGQTTISYYVHGLENTTGSSTITLTADRFTSASHLVEVVQPGLEIHNLSGSYTNLSVNDTDVYVQVGITHPSYNNAQLWQVQNVRAGSAGFAVTLTNSNVNVARLHSDEPIATGGQTGQVVTKVIPAGTYYTHAATNTTSYGLAFDPLGNGSTTVTVTASGALTMTSTGVRPVTVVTPALSVPATATVGAGLMDAVSATLGASQHGGVDVTITSSAPSVVLVSPNAATTGTESIVVHVNNGVSSAPFVIHGMENANATAVVTLSAPGFTSTTMSVTVTPSSVEIVNLTTSISAGAADDTDMYVQVGITHPSYNNAQLWQVQNVRAGSPGFVVTLTVDDPSRAQMRSDEPQATGQTVTKPIRPGFYYTQRLIQSGTTYGLAFDPLAQGTVVVTASGPPGTQSLDTSRRTVVINP